MSEACFWWGRPVLLKVLPKEDKGEARVHVHIFVVYFVFYEVLIFIEHTFFISHALCLCICGLICYIYFIHAAHIMPYTACMHCYVNMLCI